jgi:hypothetical protein
LAQPSRKQKGRFKLLKAFDKKRGFDVSKIRNTPIKRKGAQPPMKKEVLMFQK